MFIPVFVMDAGVAASRPRVVLAEYGLESAETSEYIFFEPDHAFLRYYHHDAADEKTET